MADVKLVYGTWAAVTISLASLASSSTFVAGRESTAIDNTSLLALDYLLSVEKITVGTTPTANTEIRVYVAGLVGSAVWPDVLDGTDSAETFTTASILDGACVLACRMVVSATTSNVAFSYHPVSVAALFGGTCPSKFVVYVAHSTVAVLHATAGNHVINVLPVYETVT